MKIRSAAALFVGSGIGSLQCVETNYERDPDKGTE